MKNVEQIYSRHGFQTGGGGYSVHVHTARSKSVIHGLNIAKSYVFGSKLADIMAEMFCGHKTYSS